MNVMVRSANGISQVPAATKLLSDRKIFVEGEIKPELACSFVRQMLILNQEDPDAMIDVLIDSPGGDIRSGLMIYDAISGSRALVRTICIGRSYSMASLLLAGGTGGGLILPNGEVILHEPSTICSGPSIDVQEQARSLEATFSKISCMLVGLTKQNRQEVEKAMRESRCFDAAQAVCFGICDKVAGLGDILGYEGV